MDVHAAPIIPTTLSTAVVALRAHERTPEMLTATSETNRPTTSPDATTATPLNPYSPNARAASAATAVPPRRPTIRRTKLACCGSARKGT